MADERLREITRRAAGGDQDAEAQLAVERIRGGQEITTHDFVAVLRSQTKADVVTLLSVANIPEGEKALLFLREIYDRCREAYITLMHYGIVDNEEIDALLLLNATDALLNHLTENPRHFAEIGKMIKPTLQLIPVYKPKGAGFQRMVTALDARRRPGQQETLIISDVRTRWGMPPMGEENTATLAKITRWQITVVEGAKVLPRVSNSYGERLEDQVSKWQKDCKNKGLRLCDRQSYILLQMQELRLTNEQTPLEEAGIDHIPFTSLDDSTGEVESLFRGCWSGFQVSFSGGHPEDRSGYAHFRPSIVVDIPPRP